MTGHDDLNFPAFFKAEDELVMMGHEVINPARINPDILADWLDCMRADIKQLVDCDGVYMLEGWRKSKGASLEWYIAVQLGMKVLNANH
jgi:hypothetical protein